MANTAILAIRIVSDATKAAKEIDTISTKTSRMGKVSSAAGKAFAAGLLLVGAAAVKAGNAAAQDEREAAKLANTLKNATGATQDQVKATEDWITAQGKALGVSDSELRPAIARLAAVTGDLGEAQRLTSLAMNVSAGTGKSLQTVTEALAKAQNGSLGGLSRLGVATKDASGKTLSLEAVTKKLAQTYRGSAATAAETTAGKQDRLRVRMDELQESIGQRVIPVLLALTTAGLAVVGWLEKNQTVALILVGVLGTLLAVVASINVVTKIYTATTAAWSAVTATAAAVQTAFGKASLGTRIQLAALRVQMIASAVATRAVAAATKAFAVAMRILNVVMRLNPIGLLITAVTIVIGLLILAYKKSETFRKIVDTVGRVGKAAFQFIVDKVKDVIKWAGDLIGWFRDKIPAAFQKLKDIAGPIMDAILAPFRAIKDMIEDILNLIGKIKLPSIGGALDAINPFRSISTTSTATAPVTNNVYIQGGYVDEPTLDRLTRAIDRRTRRYGT